MRKTMILTAFAALISLASCQKEDNIINGTDKKSSPVFTASIAGATKTTIDLTNGKVAWETIDEITVTDASSNSAVYTVESIDAASGKATFVIKDGQAALGEGPYTATYGTAPATVQTYSATAGKLYMTDPQPRTTCFTFTVRCGLMRLNLTKAGESIRNITVTGTPTGGAETTYTMTCNPSESIASAKDFYIALPDGIYTRIVITNASGFRCTLISDTGVVVAANHIKPVTFEGSRLDIKPTALPGKFSVGAGRQVQFSTGNLQATYDGSKYSWGFAPNQYDYIGDAAGNTTISSQTSGAVVDLFGWSTDATNFGISTSTDNADYSGDFVDWGKNIGDGSTWRTLSAEEYIYLFTTRTNASGLYKCGVTVCGKTDCLIVAPDDFAGTIADSYNALTWLAAEAAGLVCLPAAGDRRDSKVNFVGDIGRYWASSDFCGYGTYAYDVFIRGYVSPGYYEDRHFGCSVRLVTNVPGPAPAQEDPLSGKFSVSATEQVQFSKGNLQTTYDGSNYNWGFAAHQYDYIGEDSGNTTIDRQTSGKVVDLFGWSTASSNYGINTSEDDSDYSGDFVDWGKNIGDGSTWRTLSKDEWQYLFVTRTNASDLYKTDVTVCDKTNCVIIAPDGFTGSIASSYDASTWSAAEAAGLVCLPAVGFRSGSVVFNVDDYGFYWSSSARDGSSNANCVFFDSDDVHPDLAFKRHRGFSVRLVANVE